MRPLLVTDLIANVVIRAAIISVITFLISVSLTPTVLGMTVASITMPANGKKIRIQPMRVQRLNRAIAGMAISILKLVFTVASG